MGDAKRFSLPCTTPPPSSSPWQSPQMHTKEYGSLLGVDQQFLNLRVSPNTNQSDPAPLTSDQNSRVPAANPQSLIQSPFQLPPRVSTVAGLQRMPSPDSQGSAWDGTLSPSDTISNGTMSCDEGFDEELAYLANQVELSPGSRAKAAGLRSPMPYCF
eukprot:TRINITY_DN588_c0_g1_i1.p1 TRINITY_DN588_c0_g1~~TRINITY_DN588_c0_g1_i1.p1  ORF type:complete len:158 (-),score=9.92 TRINITY_DN588_c0_g1_i1:337-810(-)